MWNWILKVAVFLGQSEWAKRQALRLIARVRKRTEKLVREASDAAGVVKTVRERRLFVSPYATLKPGAQVSIDGRAFTVKRLLSSSQRETVYDVESI